MKASGEHVQAKRANNRALNLRVGEVVEVRSASEILATLDAQQTREALPFMPEMLRFCGKRFRVFRRADKVNDTVERSGLRRMERAVLLDGVRCDAAAHGGCQALCQLLWKEAWLRRVTPEDLKAVGADGVGASSGVPSGVETGAEALWTDTARPSAHGGEEVFTCQATEIRNASAPLAWWDIRQDVRDLASGNVGLLEMIRAFGFWIFTSLLRVAPGYRLLVRLYDTVQRLRGGEPYPYRQGRLRRTPSSVLGLQPGELVRVKSHDEILETLDTNNKNRGLWFDVEMVKYCGGVFRVLARVEKIIDPKSGRMLKLANDCIVLEGVTTRGDYHRFYPQNEYIFWREIWLRRVED